jgi:DNA-binding CsgD family transcriptional regulator
MFERYIERLRNVRHKTELGATLSQFTISAGFPQYRMALLLPTPHLVKPEAIIYSNCDAEWIERYRVEKLASQDPIIFLARHQHLPIVWDDLPPYSDLPPGAALVMAEAAEYGLCNGVSFPLRGAHGEFGVFSFITDDREGPVEKNLPQLGYVVNYALDAAIRVARASTPRNFKPLTKRELACLFWAAEGKTSDETATILGITGRTINAYFGSISKKLGTSNRVHSIMMATSTGLIHPELEFVRIEDEVSPEYQFGDED